MGKGAEDWGKFLADESIREVEVELGPGEGVMPGLIGGEPIVGPCRLKATKMDDGHVLVERK